MIPPTPSLYLPAATSADCRALASSLQIPFDRFEVERFLREGRSGLKHVGDRRESHFVSLFRGGEVGLRLDDGRTFRAKQREGCHIGEIRRLCLEHDVLNRRIVIEICGEQSLARGLHGSGTAAEIKK